MLDDVAVPHIQTGEIDFGFDPGDLARVGDDGVLVAALPALRRPSRSLEKKLGGAGSQFGCTPTIRKSSPAAGQAADRVRDRAPVLESGAGMSLTMTLPPGPGPTGTDLALGLFSGS